MSEGMLMQDLFDLCDNMGLIVTESEMMDIVRCAEKYSPRIAELETDRETLQQMYRRTMQKLMSTEAVVDSLIVTGDRLAGIVELDQGANDACDSWYGSVDCASSSKPPEVSK
jgi:hypothetical protein